MSTDDKEQKDYKNKIFTIPNVLSSFRILLVPLFIWLYAFRKESFWALIVLVVSGITDLLDGFIARRFNMISDLGKMLDPVADKLTAAALLICLVADYRVMWVAFGALVVKEFSDGIIGMISVTRTGYVHGSEWHGKVTTVIMYIVIGLLILWRDIPKGLSTALILLCTVLQLFSGTIYLIHNLRRIKESKE